MRYYTIIESITELLFPHYCPVCKQQLPSAKQCICYTCLTHLPYLRPIYEPDNAMEMRLCERFSCERATTLLRYNGGGAARSILHTMKFHSGMRLCHFMGGMLGDSLRGTPFLEGIDLILPVPLHASRMRERGYNQCDIIACGLSEVTGITVCRDALRQHKYTTRQSSLPIANRFGHKMGVYSLRPGAETALCGKHVLIVDDIVTTGETVTACADALSEVSDIRVSVASVASTLL